MENHRYCFRLLRKNNAGFNNHIDNANLFYFSYNKMLFVVGTTRIKKSRNFQKIPKIPLTNAQNPV